MKTKLISNSKRFLKRHSSTILTGVGVAGVVTTAVLTAKATPKAVALLEQAKEEKGDDLTKFEMVKTAAPAYIPAVITGAATIACILGANVLNTRQQAAITSAYAFLDNSYKKYKKKVEDLYGEEVDIHIEKEIAKDKYEDVNIVLEGEQKLYYDEYSRRYFESTDATVQQAEYRINRHLFQRGYAYLNEFYDELEIEPIEGGWDLGWSPGANELNSWQGWLDFNHEKVVMDDGLECTIVSFFTEPTLDFYDYA